MYLVHQNFGGMCLIKLDVPYACQRSNLFEELHVDESTNGRTDIKLLSLSYMYYGLGPERYVPILLSLWRTFEVGVANLCCSAPSNCNCELTLSRGRQNALEMMSCSSLAGLAGSRW